MTMAALKALEIRYPSTLSFCRQEGSARISCVALSSVGELVSPSTPPTARLERKGRQKNRRLNPFYVFLWTRSVSEFR